jgi:hypothetical protein
MGRGQLLEVVLLVLTILRGNAFAIATGAPQTYSAALARKQRPRRLLLTCLQIVG